MKFYLEDLKQNNLPNYAILKKANYYKITSNFINFNKYSN